MNLRYTILIFLSIAIFASGCQKKNAAPSDASVVTVEEKSLERDLYYSGNVAPLELTTVASPVDGVILNKHFDIGDFVQKDQVLLKVSSPEFSKEYKTAISEYFSSKDKLTRATTQYKGSKELLDLGIISKNEFKTDVSEFHNAGLDFIRSLTQLQNAVEISKGSIEDVKKLSFSDQDAIRKLLTKKQDIITIVSPASGIALLPPKKAESEDSNILNGSEVKRGDLIISVGDMTGIAFDIQINETDLEKVKPGETVLVTVTALPTLQLKGTLTQIAAQATQSGSMGGSSGIPLFKARVSVPKLSAEQQKLLRVGMSAKLKIIIQQKKSLMIPLSAVYLKNGQNYVKKKTNTGFEEIPVVTGEANESNIEVVRGLKAGDVIMQNQGVE